MVAPVSKVSVVIVSVLLTTVFFPIVAATGTDDPCIKAAIFVDTGALLNQECKSYVCAATLMVNGLTTDCGVTVAATNELRGEVLWLPTVMPPWTLIVRAKDLSTNQSQECTRSGDGGIHVNGIEPCIFEGTGPWTTQVDIALPPLSLLNPLTYRAGTLGMKIGPNE